jgi:micrococcal nuclease
MTPRPVRAVLLVTLLALAPSCLRGEQSVPPLESFSARVVAVLDGDSFEVLRNGRRTGVRLFGVDCPERGQPFSDRAKRFTSERIFNRTVRMDVRDIDRFGRRVSRVTVDGRDMGLELLRAGLAWHFTRYSRDPVLAAAEQDARRRRAGLWSEPHPQPPWAWRPATRTPR